MEDSSNEGDLTSAKPSDGRWRVRGLVLDLSGAFTLRTASLLALGALFFVSGGFGIGRCGEPSQETDVDWAAYARAVEFCRGDVERPMSLSPDKGLLCFDGVIASGQDISLAKELAVDGLFVVRSLGGDVVIAMALANLLRDRRATVVIYDYCISACAGYLFVASAKTFVMRGSLVAWHHFGINQLDCPSLKVSRDDGPKLLEKSACSHAPDQYRRGYEQAEALHNKFYVERTVDPRFEFPPQSFTMRRRLRSMLEGTGAYPYVAWTWNPRYYKSAIRTNVIYERYPESQDEIDAMVAKFRTIRVIYDP